MSIPVDFFVNLAASLAFELLKAGAARLSRAALGTPQQQALQRVYQDAFEAVVRASTAGADQDQARRIAGHLQRFLDLPDVASTLLDMVLAGSLAPDLNLLSERYASLASDDNVPPIDITRTLAVFHSRLTTALLDEACADKSPLYSQVSLDRILIIHGLLRGQRRNLREISHLLQQLETQATARTIIIEQATGVAIGDGATVNQFPDDVRLVLAEVLAAVRELNAQRRPPTYSQEDFRSYLHTVIERCQTLELQSAGGPVDRLPLERVYVALKADASNAAERRANHQQFLSDLAAHEQELALLADLDEYARHQIKRAVARGLDPMGLTLALRQRASAERGDYLALAAQSIDLGELISEERWAVLLGDPGAGKTTLIRWLAMQFARSLLADETSVRVPGEQVRADPSEQASQEWADLGPARLPVPLRLADYAAARWLEGNDSALTLFQYLGRQPWLGRPLHPDQATGQAIVHDAIRQNSALILLDGLDEIADQYRRGQVVDAIVHFLQTWVRDPISGLCAAEEGYVPSQGREEERPRARGGNQVVITSRPIGYYLAPLPATLTHYTVEEMSESAIARFCSAWTSAVHEQTGQGKAEADAEALRQAVLDRNRPALRELATNPLLLTILAGLFYTLKSKLPERRVEVYDQVVQAFTRQRHGAWQAQGLSDARFRYALAYVAFRLHANPDRLYANGLAGEQDVRQWLRQALRSFDGKFVKMHEEQADLLFVSAASLGGFLLERGDGAYGFIHRAFQEYFAALYLARDPDSVADEVCQRLDDPAWREPLLLAAAQTAWQEWDALPSLLRAVLDAPEPAPGLLPRNALFLAACLPEMQRQPPADLVAQAMGQLIEAYADRAWPADETTQPPEPLRQAIERALRPLGDVTGAQQAVAVALTGEDPVRRMAAAELVLAVEWWHPALIPSLLAAARDHAEPVVVVREALWRQVQAHPEALAAQRLPMRSLLADPTRAQQLVQRPVWLAILQSLYLRPDWQPDQPLTPDVVCFDSRLSRLLERAWQDQWSETKLLDRLAALADRESDPALARDAVWALAIADIERWLYLLATPGNEAIPHCSIAGLAWNARNRAFSFARAYDSDLALQLESARAGALDVALILNGDLALQLAWARARVFDVVLIPDRVPILDRVWDLTLQLDKVAGMIISARARLAAVDKAEDALAVLSRVENNLDELRTFVQQKAWRALIEAAEILGPSAPFAEVRTGGRYRIAQRVPDPRGLSSDLLTGLQALALRKLRELTGEEDGLSLADSLRALMADWLRKGDAQQRSVAIAVLAELDEVTTISLADLLPLLAAEDDQLRHRVRDALQQHRPASSYGSDLLLELAGRAVDGVETAAPAHLSADDSLLISTYCGWTLTQVLHDRGDWLQAWANELDTATSRPHATILSRIHRLYASCWPVFLELLSTGRPCTQAALLDSVSWLLRKDQVPSDQENELAVALLALSKSPSEQVARTAIFAMGCFHQPPTIVAEALLEAGKAAPTDNCPLTIADYWGALARLAPCMDQASQAEVDRLLETSRSPQLDGALVRRLVNRQEGFEEQTWLTESAALRFESIPQALALFRRKGFDARAVLARLAALRPDPVSQLYGLLAAGQDDDYLGIWEPKLPAHLMGYHERIAAVIRDLLQKHAGLWALLLAELRLALSAGEWQRHRIALVALTRCAEAMPAQFNMSAADLEPLLLQASQDAGSFHSRRFAITCLSYLRVITPKVLTALLYLAGDTRVVCNDALAAAARFNRLDPSLGEALPAELTDALTGPSVLRARTAARLLQALGTSQAAQAAPGLRRQIVQALAAALQHPGSRRPVWISVDETDGTLDQDLYQALLRVAGF